MSKTAASNSHSGWTSHLKTKQGKWLQQILDDMEEKVKGIIVVIEEDADSFGKRAEMYYKKRPELIYFVEESYRAYRALADRYEHISGELQNANNTIANLFPDQVQLAMEDEDENSPRPSRINRDKVPKVPENPKFKAPLIKDMKKLLPPKPKKPQAKKTAPQMSKDEAHEVIDKLQKEILVLQTEKEFVKSFYESGLTKYWDIEKRIEESHRKISGVQDDPCADKVSGVQDDPCADKVSGVQDDSSSNTIIKDNDSRALLSASALKSCENTLLQLQEQQERSIKEAQVQSERVMDAKEKLRTFKERHLQQNINKQEIPDEPKPTKSSCVQLEEEAVSLKNKRHELQLTCERVREYLAKNSTSSLTTVELSDMIDGIVNKVSRLESAVSSQTASVIRLRSETDELQKHLKNLDEDEMSLIDDSNNLQNKVRELEDELHGVQGLNQSVDEQSNKLQTDFTEMCRNLDDLSEKLQTPKKEEIENRRQALSEEDAVLNVESHKNSQEPECMRTSVEELTTSKDTAVEDKMECTQDLDLHKNTDQDTCIQPKVGLSKNLQDPQQDEAKDKNSTDVQDSVLNVELEKQKEEQTGTPNWKNELFKRLEEREKMLLTEYTSVLNNYRETKRKLLEIEKKNEECLHEVMEQIQGLQGDNTNKDMEIRSLKQRLNILQTSPDESINSNLKQYEDLENDRSGKTKDQWKFLFAEFQKQSSSRPMPRLLEDLLKEGNVDFATKSKQLCALTSMETPTEEDIKLLLNEEVRALSTVEEKFRRDIDQQLEENLDFWSRFSTASQQIQNFKTKVQDLHEEFSKQNKDKRKQEATDPTAKSEALAIEKKLRELQAELSVWLEQNASLKKELKYRFSSLCKIQEEILRVSKEQTETEQENLTPQLAARYKGEVMNMKQENNKVEEELKAGLDLVKGLHLEVDKVLGKLNANHAVSGSRRSRRHQQQQHRVSISTSKSKVPLRSFLFGSKAKKQGLFSAVSPAIQKQYGMKAARSGLPM